MKKTTALILALAAFGMPALNAQNLDKVEATARSLYKTQADSVLFIRAVVTVNVSVGEMSQPPQEQTTEQLATVIGADGLLVTSNMQLDPASMANGKTINTPKGPLTLSATSEVKELHVIMPDGTEIPARVVLKDKDLDLAFIKVDMASDEAKGMTLKAIDPTVSAAAGVVDNLVVLSRLSKVGGRYPKVYTTSVNGIMQKPRIFYSVIAEEPGTPAFDGDGKFVGLTTVRIDSSSSEMGEGNVRGLPVLLPANEIAKLVGQAREAAAKSVEKPVAKPVADEEVKPASSEAKQVVPEAEAAPANN